MSSRTAYVLLVLIILIALGGFLWLRNKSNSTKTSTMNQTQTQDQTETQAQVPDIELTDGEVILIDVKDYGQIKVQLNKQAAPQTSSNFLKLATEKFYDGLTFHRIAAGFVIQGGDPKGDGSGGPGYTVPAEIGLPHKKGAIAMARLGDQVNPKKDSSGSQFYIALEDLPMLDGEYTVFGQVIEGMNVVEKIGQAPINGFGDGPPVTPITINFIRIIN